MGHILCGSFAVKVKKEYLTAKGAEKTQGMQSPISCRLLDDVSQGRTANLSRRLYNSRFNLHTNSTLNDSTQ